VWREWIRAHLGLAAAFDLDAAIPLPAGGIVAAVGLGVGHRGPRHAVALVASVTLPSASAASERLLTIASRPAQDLEDSAPEPVDAIVQACRGRLAAVGRREPVSDAKIETVQSRSIGVVGRALSSARHHHFVLDSSSAPEALSNSEAFLAGISSCGVTLVEAHARDTGAPLQRMEVTIAGVRTAAEPNRFQRIDMRFELHGVDQATADRLVETYKAR
jgi:uncharacterized OsmC-like protein